MKKILQIGQDFKATELCMDEETGAIRITQPNDEDGYDGIRLTKQAAGVIVTTLVSEWTRLGHGDLTDHLLGMAYKSAARNK